MAYQDRVIIGDCTLYLGDCLDVMKDMPDKSVDAVITDPPLGDSQNCLTWQRILFWYVPRVMQIMANYQTCLCAAVCGAGKLITIMIWTLGTTVSLCC
jgi:late competence protein required for DNA uptake (superfamily II DNA/RNA helicase)